MGYRPITDTWFLARAKLKGGRKYYGAYPGGFLERARALLGVGEEDAVLHVCGGRVKDYPYRRGFGPHDKTLDLDPALEPDYLQDASLGLPTMGAAFLWPAVLIDPPYTETDADHYVPGRDSLPRPNVLLKNALEVVRPGGRVGLLHYILPQPPKEAVFVAAVSVLVGFNNRVRVFSVFERPWGNGS